MSPLGTLEAPERRAVTAEELEAQHPELDNFIDTDTLIDQINTNQNGTKDGEADQDVSVALSTDTEHAPAPQHLRDEISQVGFNLTQPQSPVAPAPMTPQPPRDQLSLPGQNEPFELVMVDRSNDAMKIARSAAEHRLSQESNQGGKLKRLARAMWKTGVAHEWYRQRYIREEFAEIVKHQDVLITESSSKAERERAQKYLFERFKAGGGHVVTSESLGKKSEQRKELGEDSALGKKLKDLIEDAVTNNLSKDELQQQYEQITDEFRNSGTDELFGEGAVTSENIHEVVEQMRGASLHGESLVHAVKNMRIISGESRTGGRSEAHYNLADKAIEKIAKSKRLGWISPELAASGIGIAIGATKVLRGSAARAILGVAAPVAVGAVLGGLRERKRTKDDIAQHQRERELGKTFEGSDKLRAAIEDTMYDDREASELADLLKHSSSEETLDQGGDEALKVALEAIAEVQARQGFTYMGKTLIRHSDPTREDEEMFYLQSAKIEATNQLRKRLGSLDDDTRARLNIPAGASVRDVLASDEYEPRIVNELREDIEAKDEARKKLIRKRMGVGALKGAFISGSLSVAANAIAGGFESAGSSQATESGYERNGGDISINNGYDVLHNADGTIDIKDADGNVVLDNVARDPNGMLPPESVAKIEAAGLDVSEPHEMPSTLEDRPVSLQEFINNHSQETLKVSETDWLGNNTQVSDGNELRSDWTGTGVGPNGEVTLNASSMTPGESFNGDHGFDPVAAMHNGNLKLLVSFDEATKNNPIMLSYGPDGQLVIPPDSPAAKAFWPDENGQQVFHGFEAKTAVVTGENPDGTSTVASFATIVGENDMPPTLIDKVETEAAQYSYEITAPVEQVVETGEAPATGLVWTAGRRGLSAAERKPSLIDLRNQNMSPFYYGGGSLEAMRQWIRQDPNRLQTRRLEKGADGSTKWLEADGSPVERKVDRERQVLNRYLENERTKNPNHFKMVEGVADALGKMKEQARVAVNVPAWMEAGNLEHFLSEYTEQIDKNNQQIDPDLFEINILINRKTGAFPDNSVEIINKFITDFEQAHGFRPNIRFADVELGEGLNNVGYARKLLTDAVALRSIERDNQSAPLYMESEDADLLTVDKQTVYNLITKLDANPHLDAVRGVQDRSPENMKENDMLFLRRRAWDFFEIMARSKQFRNPTSPKWNFTWNRTVTGGWNTGYTAEVYGIIGGYDVVPAGEDMSIGEKITMARGDGNVPNLEVVGTVSSRTNSSPRRFINEIASDKGAYEDFTNEDANKNIRERSLPELLESIKQFERITPQNEKAFERYIAGTFGWAQTATPTLDDAKQFERRLLFWLGFKKDDYEFTDNGVSIKSWDNIKNSLEKYRQRYAT